LQITYKLASTVILMKRKKIMIIGFLIALGSIAAIDGWLPNALVSHYKYPVISNPPIFQQYGVKAENISFKTRDNVDISGWFIPAKTSSKKTLILLHTRGGTRQDLLEFSLPLQKAGFNLALIDLRGHGASGGQYFTFGFHEREDVSGLIDYLEKRGDGSSEDITLVGVSVGGVVAIQAVEKDTRIKRLVTIAAFADLGETIQEQTPWLPGFWRERAIKRAEEMGESQVRVASPIQAIKNIKCPVLVAHGTQDTYIPFSNAQKLFAAAPSPKEFYQIQDTSHETMLQKGGDGLRQKITDFILK
jgi:uncharacterized protein